MSKLPINNKLSKTRIKALRQGVGSLALEGMKPTDRIIGALNKIISNEISVEQAKNKIRNFK